MEKTFTKIFTQKELPFLELRYSNSNTHYKEHFHDTFSLGVNKEGESIYTNSGKEYHLVKNKLSIMNPKEVHSCNSCTDVLNKYYMMYLDPKWCKEIQKLTNDTSDSFIKIPEALFEDKVSYEKFVKLCEFLFSSATVVEKEEALIDFFTEFFSLFLKEQKEKLTDDNFKNILSFIDKNFKESLCLDTLAKEFKLNKYYIIRLFKSQMNQTPHAYLLNVRINHAKELLKKGEDITQTALECGFFDQSHFHRNFLKIVATTPKEYQLNFVQ